MNRDKGALDGQFTSVSCVSLGETVIKHALSRSGLERTEIDEVIMGQVIMGGHGVNPARQVCLGAKLPLDVTARTVNMACGSGLRAIYDGYNAIKCGESRVVLAGGMENMTQSKHCAFVRGGVKLGPSTFEDMILCDALMDPIIQMHMGKTAERLAKKFVVSREEQDKFAYLSHRKASVALINDNFKEEIVPVVSSNYCLVINDENVRPETTLKSLAEMKTVFIKSGSFTIGNSAAINDGAAAVVLCDTATVESKSLKPLAKIIGFSQVGCDPLEMGLGPVPAIKKLLQRIAWSVEEVDLFEINEAFATQAIVVIRELGLDENKVNISGGAIALGHPIGCSGARILVTLIYNLRRIGKNKGIASLCIGGGMGIAIAIELC